MAAAVIAKHTRRKLDRLKENKENFWTHELEDTVELMKKYTKDQGEDKQNYLTHDQLEGCLRDVNTEVLHGMAEVCEQNPKVALMMGLKRLPQKTTSESPAPRLKGMHEEPTEDEIAYVLRHIDNGGDFEKVEVDEVNKALSFWNGYLWELPKLELRLQQAGLTPPDEAEDAKATEAAAEEDLKMIFENKQVKVFMESFLISGDAPVTDDSVVKLLEAFDKPYPDRGVSRADLYFFSEFWKDTLAKRRDKKKMTKSASCVVL